MRHLVLAALGAALCACPSSKATGQPGTGALGGRVMAGAQPAAGAVITLSGPASGAAVADAEGRFRFVGLAAGTYAVRAEVSSTAEGFRSAVVQVSAGGEATAPDLVLTPVGRIVGRVTLEGLTVGNVGIAVAVEGTSALGLAGDDGAYSIDGVPAGLRAVVATRTGYVPAAAGGLAVAWGGTATAPELVLPRGSAAAAGRVAGATRLAGVADRAGIRATVEGPGFSALSGADGGYVVGGVPTGVWALTLARDGFEARIPGVVVIEGSAFVVAGGVVRPVPEVEIQRGRQIPSTAYTLFEPTTRTLFTMDGTTLRAFPRGGEARIVAEGVQPYTLAQVPGRPEVLFQGVDGRLFRALAAGGPAVAIGPCDTPYRFTASGRRLLFAAGGVASVLDLATGAVRSVGRISVQAQLTGDERYLVEERYHSEGGNGYVSLEVASLAGGGVLTLSGRLSDAWSSVERVLTRDGKSVLFGEGGALVLASLDGTQRRELATGLQPYSVQAPDRSTLAVNASAGVVVVDQADGSVRATAPVAAGFLSYAPGGDVLLIRGQTYGTLLGLPLDGRPAVTLSTSANDAVFSPRADILAVRTYELGSEGLRFFSVPALAELSTYASTSYLAIRRYLGVGRVLVDEGGVLRSIPVAGGPAATLASNSAYQVAVSPAGDRILFTTAGRAGAWALWSATAAGDVVLKLADDVGSNWMLPPDWSRVFYQVGTEWRAVPVAGGATESFGSTARAWQLAPDGRSIYWIADEPSPGTLYVAPVGGGAVHALAEGAGAWWLTRDQRNLTVMTAAGLLGGPAAGPLRLMLADPAVYQESPDGLGLLATDGAGWLWNLPFAGPLPTTPLLRRSGAWMWLGLTISPDGRALATLADGLVTVVPLAGGTPQGYVRSGAGGYQWLDDGTLLVSTGGLGSDLWFQEGLYLVELP